MKWYTKERFKLITEHIDDAHTGRTYDVYDIIDTQEHDVRCVQTISTHPNDSVSSRALAELICRAMNEGMPVKAQIV